ncbi:MAG: transposase [Bdellovibrionota bacterium]
MPRKKLVYTHHFPYHIWARSNNREWFYLPTEVVWRIFAEELVRITKSHELLVHAFVLMNNHYHMIASAHEDFPLHDVMQILQKSVSRAINKRASRTNHVFGGPYKASLIKTDLYYATALRYVAQNPIRAKLSQNVEGYRFSTFSHDDIPTCSPLSGIAAKISTTDLSTWLNSECSTEQALSISRGLKKTVFKPVFPRT